MSHLSRDQKLLVVRHLLAGHGQRGAARATGAASQTVLALNRRLIAGELAELVAEAKRYAPPSAIEAMPKRRRERLGLRDGSNRAVEPVSAQVKPHPLKPDPNRRRGRPLLTESGKTISHEELLIRLVVRTSYGWRGMGEGAGI